jgi:arylsulfatase A-like enzyme
VGSIQGKLQLLAFHILLWVCAGVIDSQFVSHSGYEGHQDVFNNVLLSILPLYGLIGLILGIIDNIFVRRARPYDTERRNTHSRLLGMEAGALALVIFGYHINDRYLPSLDDPVSIIWNVIFLLSSIIVGFLFIRILNRPAGDKVLNGFTAGLSIYIFISILALASGHRIASNDSVQDTRPNILLIVLDTTRPDHLGVYGYDRDTSPNLDSFGAENHVFRNCRTPMPLTSPAHASIFSGAMPHENGVLTNISKYPEIGFFPLSEKLKKQGYYTMGFPSAVHLGNEFNYDRGWDTYCQTTSRKFQDRYQWAPFGIAARVGLAYERHIARNSDEVNHAFLSLVDTHEQVSGAPFFAWVHYFDPHTPYQPDDEYLSLFSDGYSGELTGSQADCDRINSHIEEFKTGAAFPEGISQDDIDHMIDRYDAEIREMDDHFGDLIEHLKELGIYENTVIVIVSDHGEGLYDNGYFGHNISLKEFEIQVVCMVKGPDIAANPDEFLSLTDLADYVEYVSGVDENPESSRLTSGIPDNRFVDDPSASMIFLRAHSWLEYPWKLIRNASPEGKGTTYELYNLMQDPLEKNDLFDPEETGSNEIRGDLQHWIEFNSADFTDLLKRAGTTESLDPSTLEMLRSLGYIY